MNDSRGPDQRCLEALIVRQLPEGGWPFFCGAIQASLEPTALALLALPLNSNRERDAGIRFLLRIQNSGGSWPAFAGDDHEGSGLTGLALLALIHSGVRGLAIERGVEWLLHSRGWESHWLWKWKFRTTDRRVRFDPDKFGWPWMPETVSWVFPTAYSLLALQRSLPPSQTGVLQFRIQRGVEMLFDRICPGGGWNAGNGVVYGNALVPHLDATAVALLALLREPVNPLVTASLNWLERRAETCYAPWSLGWTILALNAFRRPTGQLITRLSTVAEPVEINDCATLSVASLALSCTNQSSPLGIDA
jgi:hypothetical protein